MDRLHLVPVEAEAAGDEGPRHPGEAEPHLQLHHEAAAQPGLGLHVHGLHQQAEMRVLSNIHLPKLVPCCKLSWLANLISKFISTIHRWESCTKCRAPHHVYQRSVEPQAAQPRGGQHDAEGDALQTRHVEEWLLVLLTLVLLLDLPLDALEVEDGSPLGVVEAGGPVEHPQDEGREHHPSHSLQ